ncbi:MAG TPA: hypothetical protein VHS31_16705, partial [Tepidisphaeraceae bacterium]|nr:hypothetical protein [Tepidisphaeraceae bacterium]
MSVLRSIKSAAKTKLRDRDAWRAYRERYRQFVAGNDGRFCVKWEDRYPCLPGDPSNNLPPADYLLHAGWGARKLFALNPASHIDVSSI